MSYGVGSSWLTEGHLLTEVTYGLIQGCLKDFSGSLYYCHGMKRVYSTVTDLAKFRGLSTSVPRTSAA